MLNNKFRRNKLFIYLLAVSSIIIMLQGIREFYLHGYLYKNFFGSLILWSTGWALILVILLLKEDEITHFINKFKKSNLTIYASIFFLGIILRIIVFNLPGYSSYDAWNYVVTGYYINDGWIPYKDPDIHPHFLTQYAPFFYLLLDILINPNFDLSDWRVLINLLDIFTAILLSLIPQDRFSKLFVSIAYLFNPLIIFETAWNGHNDLLVVLFLILGMILIKGTELPNFKTIRGFNVIFKNKKVQMLLFFIAGIFFGLSTMIKWISLPIILVFYIKIGFSKLNRLSLIIGSLLAIIITMGYYFIIVGPIFLEKILDIILRGGNPFISSSLSAFYFQIIKRFHLPIITKILIRLFFYGHILSLIILYLISRTKYKKLLEKELKNYKIIHIISIFNFILFIFYFYSLSILNFVFEMDRFINQISIVLNSILLVITLILVKLDSNLIYNSLTDPVSGRIDDLNIISYISMILVLSVLKTWAWYSVLPITLLIISKNKKLSILWILYLIFQAYYCFYVTDFGGEGWFLFPT